MAQRLLKDQFYRQVDVNVGYTFILMGFLTLASRLQCWEMHRLMQMREREIKREGNVNQKMQ